MESYVNMEKVLSVIKYSELRLHQKSMIFVLVGHQRLQKSLQKTEMAWEEFIQTWLKKCTAETFGRSYENSSPPSPY